MKETAFCVRDGKMFAVLPCLSDDESLCLPDACAVEIDVEAREHELLRYSPLYKDDRLLLLDILPRFIRDCELVRLGSTSPQELLTDWTKTGELKQLWHSGHTAENSDMALNRLRMKVRLVGCNEAYIRFEDDFARAIEFKLPPSR